MAAYYCEMPDVINKLETTDGQSIGIHITFFLLNTTTWIAAAEFHSKVGKTLRKWREKCLSTVHSQIPKLNVWDDQATVKRKDILEIRNDLKLIAIWDQIQQEPVVLSCRLFSVTYGFLGSVS